MKFFSADLKESTARLDDVNRAVYEATRKKEALEVEYDEEVKELQAKYLADRKAKEADIATLTSQVSSLESRKAEALKPLDDYKKSLDVKEAELSIREKNVEKEHASIDEKKSEYEILIDQAQELSTDLHGKIAKANAKLERADGIEKAVIHREKDLILRVDLFNEHTTQKERELADKFAKLEDEKALVVARTQMLDVREEKLNTQQGLIDSRNETLKLAMKEIQKWQAKMQK